MALNRATSLRLAPRDVVLAYHHNVAFEPETSEVLGCYDFDAIACVDRHRDFKYLHSYTPPFRLAVLEAYRSHTSSIPDTQCITFYHALAALASLAWRVDDPEAHDRFSGRAKAEAYRWVRQAVAWALAQVAFPNSVTPRPPSPLLRQLLLTSFKPD